MTKDETLKLALEALEKKAGSWGVGQESLNSAAITAIKETLAQPERTGWPAGLLQDDDRKLSKWLASRPDAKHVVDMAQPEQDSRRLQIAMRQWEDWKTYALELQKKLVKYEGGSPMILNTQPDERNFCPRCGKRLASGFVEISIHTCTPPQIDPNQWAFDRGLEST